MGEAMKRVKIRYYVATSIALLLMAIVLGLAPPRVAAMQPLLLTSTSLALNPDDGRVLALGSGALQYDGQVERARQWAQRALEVDANDMNALLNAACLHAKLGEKERALELLERACGRGWGKRDWIENDPDYDRLRDDPRYLAMLGKMGLSRDSDPGK